MAICGGESGRHRDFWRRSPVGIWLISGMGRWDIDGGGELPAETPWKHTGSRLRESEDSRFFVVSAEIKMRKTLGRDCAVLSLMRSTYRDTH